MEGRIPCRRGRERGAGAERNKHLMDEAGLLPQWYAHQDQRLWEELEAWVEEHGLKLAEG